MIAPCGYLEKECSGRRRESSIGDERRNAGCGLEDENNAAGGKREGEEETMWCEILHYQEKSSLPEKLHEDWSEEVAANVLGPCGSVGRSSRRHRAYRKAEVEEADGSSSRQERVSLVFASSWK